jgi:hypothetical protein
VSRRWVVVLVAVSLLVSLGVDYVFHLDSPKPNRPAIRDLQRRVTRLEARVAKLERELAKSAPSNG